MNDFTPKRLIVCNVALNGAGTRRYPVEIGAEITKFPVDRLLRHIFYELMCDVINRIVI